MYHERRGRRSGRRFPPKPVETGAEYDVEIQEVSRRGDGVARIKGFVCFVPNTKPGDKVRIRITRLARRFAEAEVVEKAEEEAGETEAVVEESETVEPVAEAKEENED
jgi:predicted RNA-binding protein with TRAM domain